MAFKTRNLAQWDECTKKRSAVEAELKAAVAKVPRLLEEQREAFTAGVVSSRSGGGGALVVPVSPLSMRTAACA
jgi:hypothetical protein